MGFLDKIKGLLKGREQQVKSGIDTVSDKVEEKVPQHADKVVAASEKAKDAVDSLAGNDDAPAAAPATPPAAAPATPPAAAPATPPVAAPETPPAAPPPA